MAFFQTRATFTYKMRGQEVVLYLLPAKDADLISEKVKVFQDPKKAEKLTEQEVLAKVQEFAELLATYSELTVEDIQDKEFGLTVGEIFELLGAIVTASYSPKGFTQAPGRVKK